MAPGVAIVLGLPQVCKVSALTLIELPFVQRAFRQICFYNSPPGFVRLKDKGLEYLVITWAVINYGVHP